MIHYTLNQDASINYGCVSNLTDILSKVCYIPLHKSGIDPLPSVLPEEVRSPIDFISEAYRNSLGERPVINVQLKSDLKPSVIEDRLSHTYFTYDGTAWDYLIARRSAYTTGYFDMTGSCYFASANNHAFIPVQEKFGTRTQRMYVYSTYERESDSSLIYSWVPLGVNLALIETRYSSQRYFRLYEKSSSAQCTIKVFWTEVVDGSFTNRSYTVGQVLSSSGVNPQTDAIIAYERGFVPDPTKAGLDYVRSRMPMGNKPSSTPYHLSLRYDPKASSEFYKELAMLRLSAMGENAKNNSLRSLPSYDDWADLADTAIDNCKYVDINAYAFARDLRSVGSELKSLLRVIASPTNPKSWAGLYLNARYGTRLTVSDARSLMSGLKRSAKTMQSTWPKGYDVVRSMKLTTPADFTPATTSSRTLHYKVCYKPNRGVLKDMARKLWNWDMYPSLQNLWDLVPYSFVVDWGGDIERILEQLDREEYEELIKVLGCTYSLKDEYFISMDLSDLGFQNVILVTSVYLRSTSSLHQSSLRLTTGHSSTINVVDGISLILQRMK